MVPTMTKVSDTFTDFVLDKCAKEKSIDVFPLLKLPTLDTIGLTAFGYDFHAISNGDNAIANAYEFLGVDSNRRAFKEPLNPASIWYSIPTTANRQRRQAEEIIRSVLNDIVATRMKQTQEQKSTHNDLLASMIIAAAEEESPVTPDTFADNLLTFLFAGFDTTSVALSYALYLLAIHPEAQVKARAEINTILGQDKVITYEKLQNMEYIYAVFMEALRLYPPAPFTSRNLEKDLPLDDIVIPKGTMAVLSLWWINRSKLNWGDDAEEFKPERHLPGCKEVEGVTAKDKAFRMMAFSGGQRNCVGYRFAIQEAMIMLISLLRRCQITQPTNAPPVQPFLTGIVQQPENGVWLTLTPQAASA
ncbi:hypothetical protein THRCLA_04116 [Thraustotheca clavata]|uniref:Cytochrome P450 n=1 Tax=Thraustotheca clavata TaxID=74557 RepID=A0A1V9ZZY9_9STRA|nr:hypothetical protein THRCLA_04116 [Thraustotheca clavata]